MILGEHLEVSTRPRIWYTNIVRKWALLCHSGWSLEQVLLQCQGALVNTQNIHWATSRASTTPKIKGKEHVLKGRTYPVPWLVTPFSQQHVSQESRPLLGGRAELQNNPTFASCRGLQCATFASRAWGSVHSWPFAPSLWPWVLIVNDSATLPKQQSSDTEPENRKSIPHAGPHPHIIESLFTTQCGIPLTPTPPKFT